jgi:DNA-binding NarL/FixJ family response regulator
VSVPAPSPIRILVADDFAVVREGVKALLERQADLRVTVFAVDGMEAVEKATKGDVDLVILDIAMPKLTGLQAVREIARRRPDLPILLLSMHADEQYFFEAVAAGAAGYVLKQQADRDIIAACRAVLRGEPFIYPPALGALMRRYLEQLKRGDQPRHGPLTQRENEVVKLIAEGRNTHEIADLLTISAKTVERHRANILGKLGMRDRVGVTRYAIRSGLIEP